MYVYAGAVVRVLGHDARHERHTQTVEFVREPVSGNGVETGIAEDDLVEAARGRVAIVSRLHVCGERGAHLRQTREKLCGTIGRRPVGYVASVFNLLAVIDRATDLLGQRLVEPSHTRFDV